MNRKKTTQSDLDSKDFLPRFVIVSIAVFQLATNVYIPCLPSVSENFHTNPEVVQFSVGGFLVGSAFSNLIYGALSGFYGRKPIFSLGLWIFFISSLLAMVSPSIHFLIFLRIFQGIGAGCISVLCFSMVQEKYTFKRANKIIGWMGVMREATIAFSPILGGYLVLVFGWRSTFFIVALSIAALLYYCQKFVEETYHPSKKFRFKPLMRDYKNIITDLSYIRYISLFPFLLCGLWCYLTVVPFYFISFLHIPVDEFGYYVAPAALAYSVGSILTPKLIKQFGLNSTLLLGLYLSLSSGVLQLLIHFICPGKIVLIVLTQSLYVMGSSFVFAPSITKAVQPFEENRATAISVGALLRQLCAGLGGIFGAFFDDSSLLHVSFFLIFLSVAALVIFKGTERF